MFCYHNLVIDYYSFSLIGFNYSFEVLTKSFSGSAAVVGCSALRLSCSFDPSPTCILTTLSDQ